VTASAIVVDTSALMAIVLNEPDAERCIEALASADELFISAGTVAEVLIVAGRRNVDQEIKSLINGLGFKTIAVSEGDAHSIGQAHQRWGKGAHAAGLNFGDCFAYVTAQALGYPLLYIGNDFARTDIESAL
jgi:ribonuclease VapC